MNQLTIGRIVRVFVDGRSNNGSDLCPAILTRVWGTGKLADENGLVAVVSANMRLMLDHPSNDPDTNEWRTSAQVFASRGHAEAYLDNTARAQYGVTTDEQVAEWVKGRKASGMVAFMPPRL